ncbi:AAA family ATPase [Janthinobacterium sp. BJB1]|uniref:AAA family ATPase n=1 Tax=Janthinobacterium sp. GW458P TaxID=1981504 RepID=UPI000A324DBD|nr:AAA family ATPase [Janthinobacterium sp. GW458P]MBE3028318.1 AAA family ATPase [Janthinobacterium sp. GW458P]PHV14587.1 AAA family ATPase [Janthinobacterium sp. BJB303]PJC97033.1 AAA family ATPase [Janthinobacterium sp. BJB1]
MMTEKDNDSQVVRRSAEQRYASELERLKAADADARPEGWRLSPRAVRRFILGDAALQVSRKFYGDDPLVDRAIVTLMGHQGLMLVGEPGTAKSLLSELLAAAISGDSALAIQGTAGTTEDHIKYSWNYALLLAEGPSRRALVPSPLYQGMEAGKLVRFEEITRCAPEMQDVLISLMSEKQMMIPELGGDARVHARRGFNIIASANLRDRGVHEMSSALKRRFNFETVKPIRDHGFEVELVMQQLRRELDAIGATVVVGRAVVELLVTTFQELRAGQTREGTAIKTPEAVMSSAEAVNLVYAASLEALHFGDGTLRPRELANQLQGVVLKDNADDIKRVRHYFDTVVRERGRRDDLWKSFGDAARQLWL